MTSLVKKIDQRMTQAAGKYPGGRKLGTYVMIGDANGRANQLRSLASKESLQHISLCIGVMPPRYEINPLADVTVVIYNPARRGQQAVTANFALRMDELDETKRNAIVEAVSRVVPR